MVITFMGTGTSHGIPVVGCTCAVCRSENPRNKRSRSSLLISENGPSRPGFRLLIDTATEFRLQAVREGLFGLDALLYTHAHADHLHGLDDIRPLSREKPIPVYSSPAVLRELREHFAYIFRSTQEGGGKPRISLHPIDSRPFSLGPWLIQPIPILHGDLPILGYRIGPLAYLTDCSRIPDTSLPLLGGIQCLIIGALRERPHPTHFTVQQAEAAGRRLGAETVDFTHLCHDMDHEELERRVSGSQSPRFRAAWDGLSFSL